MNLKNLAREIPYKWRVQSFSKFKPSAQCVAYIDARAVMDLLDEVVSVENWQDKYEVVHNHLFASIGIFAYDKWIWKTDCGVESNIEVEKGEASDAFKRAAVKWGIGRFLYALDIKRVGANKTDDGKKPKPYVIDESGKRVWNLTKYINGLNGKEIPPKKGQNKPKTVSFNQKQARTPKQEEVPENEAQAQGKGVGKPVVDFKIAGKEVSKEKFIQSVFQEAAKWKVDVSKIINNQFNSAEPDDLTTELLLKFAAVVKKQILEKKK